MAIAFVQKAEHTTAVAATFFTLAYSSNNTAGNFLFAFGRLVCTGGGDSTLTDSQSNVWNKLSSSTVSSAAFVVWYAPNCKAGANTVTCTSNAGTNYTVANLVIFEYSGLAAVNPLDQISGLNSGTGTAAAGPTITTIGTSDLVIVACCNDTLGPDNPISASSGFAVRQDATTNCCLIDKLNATAGSYTPTITLNASAGWRTYTIAFSSLSVAAGIWNKLGTILYNPTTDDSGSVFGGTSNGDVLYDVNPQLISANADGKVFKIWFMSKSDTWYAEANNPGGPWTRGGAALLTTAGLPKVYKSGSTYYLYVCAPPTGAPQAIKCYTSPDGITLTLANATALSVGAVAAWDHSSVQYMKPYYFDGVTYYAAYSGTLSGVGGVGVATSTNLTSWTNSPTKLIANLGAPGPVIVGSILYLLSANVPNPGVLPAGLAVTHTSDLTGATGWSAVTQFLAPTQVNEGAQAPTSEGMGPPMVVEATGKSCLFYTGAVDALGTHYRQMAAVSSLPLAGSLSNAGGLVNYTVTAAQSATDTMQRSNETPLSDGGAWATFSASGSPYYQSNLISNKAVAINTGAASAMAWSAITSASQYSEITTGTKSASAVWNISAVVKETTTTYYRFIMFQSGAWQVNAIYGGTVSEVIQSGDVANIPNAIGTVLRLVYSNGVLLAYANGNLVTAVGDSTITGASPGFLAYDGTTPGSTGISAWAGGTASVILNFTTMVGNAGAFRLRRRKRIYAIP